MMYELNERDQSNYLPGHKIYDQIQLIKEKLEGGLWMKSITPSVFKQELNTLQVTINAEDIATYLAGLNDLEAYLFAYQYRDDYQLALLEAAKAFFKPEETNTVLNVNVAQETQSSAPATVSNPHNSYVYLQSTLKKTAETFSKGITYVRKNPTKVFAGGLLAQATVTAAMSPQSIGSKSSKEMIDSQSVNLLTQSSLLSHTNHALSSVLNPKPVTTLSKLAADLMNDVNSPATLNDKRFLTNHSVKKTVGQEFRINTYTNNEQSYSVSARLNDGNILVVWSSYGQDTSHYGIYGKILDANGNEVVPEFLINSYVSGEQSNPAITVLNNGNFVVIWSSLGQDTSGFGIYGQIFTASGSKVNSEFRVNTYTANHQHDAHLAALSNGNFVIAWQSVNQVTPTSGLDTYCQLYNASGAKINSEFLVNKGGGAYVVGLDNGSFLVIRGYSANDNEITGLYYDVYGQLFNADGQKVGGEFLLNTNRTSFQGYSAATRLNNGNIIVVWVSNLQDGSGYGIYGQIITATGAKVGSEIHISQTTAGAQDDPRVSSLPSGGFFAVWHGNGQAGYGVYGRVFNANGFPQANEFCINTNVINDSDNEVYPFVIDLEDGKVFVTWDNNGEIYGKIFDPFTPSFSTTNQMTTASTSTSSTTGQMTTGSTSTSSTTGQMTTGSTSTFSTTGQMTTGSTSTSSTTGQMTTSSTSTSSTTNQVTTDSIDKAVTTTGSAESCDRTCVSEWVGISGGIVGGVTALAGLACGTYRFFKKHLKQDSSDSSSDMEMTVRSKKP